MLVAATRQAFGAPSAELRVITRDSSEITRQILLAIGRRLGEYATSMDVQELARRPGRGIYAAIGPAALQTGLAADLQGPLVSLFASAEAFRRLNAGVVTPGRRPAVTAIYAEASALNQMQVIRILYNRRVTVGVLLTPATAVEEAALQFAARSEMLDLEVRHVTPGENVVRALAQLRSANVVLALPDPGLYTAENLRSVLESTYRREQGMVGFSAALVNAGMLAAPYSSLDDTIADFAELLAAYEGGGALSGPRHPVYWRVAVNEKVAQSLNIVVDPGVRAIGRTPK